MNKKQLITAGVLAGVIALGSYGIQTVKAAESTDSLPPMIQRMAEKFNLNQDEVKKFVNEDREAHRTEMQAQRKADFEARLTELVSEGKLTEEQKSGIIAKHNELDVNRDAIREQNLTRDEMHTQMQAVHTEMKDYLKSINIDENILPGPKGQMGGMKGKGMMGRGDRF